MSNSLFGLLGTKYFSRLDLVKSYYQIPIDENSHQYTSFSTQKNHWQFKRLSFGLRNAPSAFQRKIQAVLSAFPSNKVIAYIDDILIMGSSFEEHLSLVHKVLQTLENYKFKVKSDKCDFFRTEIEFLGHIISQSGIRKTPEYVQKIRDYPRPQTKGELREFLGFINFQRKFLPKCSVLQRPLSCHTSGRRNCKLEWTTEMVESFEALKVEMQHDLELAYPDYSEEAEKLELWVDASNYGAGAYLAQEQGDSFRVIGFASMMFSGPQLHYSTLERELCALRWGIKTFRPFLFGVPFILHTDHQPLVHLHNMKIICSRLARTVEELADYVFEIRYVPGHLNSAADALSRIKCHHVVPDSNIDVSLPQGLIVDSTCIPGGGDSMLLSLQRCLSRINGSRPLPDTAQGLREQLVDELLTNSEKYNLKLDRDSRKTLRSMRCRGQLPSFDLLLAASCLYSVSIHVYFWPKSPVIYQFKDFDNIIHLQCISGVHFNSLIAIGNYSQPDQAFCSINTVQFPEMSLNVNGSNCDNVVNNCDKINVCDNSCDTDLIDNVLINGSLNIDCSPNVLCNHAECTVPRVAVSFGNRKLCAILDTGAQISLISTAALQMISEIQPVNVIRENVCDVVGFSGQRETISHSVYLSFSIGSFNMSVPQKFAVITADNFPYCILLGLDFLNVHNINIDLNDNVCLNFREPICKLTHDGEGGAVASNFVVQLMPSASHILKMHCENNEFRFEIDGTSSSIAGLSLLGDDSLVRSIQSGDPQIQSLVKAVKTNVKPKKWKNNIKRFSKHCSNLSIHDGVLVYTNPRPVVVVPFKFLVGIALVLHNEFAHVGQNKLLGLVNGVFWHPSKHKICNDVCNTCSKCQVLKEF